MSASTLTDVVQVSNVVQISGSITAAARSSSSATNTSFAASLSDQLIAAASTDRVGVSVTNAPTSDGYLYLNMGAVALTSSYSVVLWPGSCWESPYGYVGSVHGVFTTTTGSCFVTEYQ